MTQQDAIDDLEFFQMLHKGYRREGREIDLEWYNKEIEDLWGSPTGLQFHWLMIDGYHMYRDDYDEKDLMQGSPMPDFYNKKNIWYIVLWTQHAFCETII